MPDSSDAMGLLYTTWPDEESAQAAARTLLGEGAIACANILGASRSLFEWQGEVQCETEIVALFKTGAASAARTAQRIAELHPYDEPAVLNLAVSRDGSSPGFLDWVTAQTSGAIPL